MTDKQNDRRMDGMTDGRTDGRTDGKTVGESAGKEVSWRDQLFIERPVTATTRALPSNTL